MGFKKDYQHIYNLNDGACFKNTIPMHAEHIDLSSLKQIDKEALKKELLSNFSSHSLASPTKDELDSIQERLSLAIKTKELILQQDDFTFVIYEEYLESLQTLIQKLITSESEAAYDLALVYQEYFRLISTFIFDFFNSNELSDKYKHANMINHLLCTQLLRIVDAYIQELDSTIKR